LEESLEFHAGEFWERQALKESKRFDFNEIPRNSRTKAMQDDGDAQGRKAGDSVGG